MAEKGKASKKADFIWVPGEGPSSDALKRLARHCPKPKQTMGEAWFLSEKRHIYTELERTDLESIQHAQMERIFWDMTSGPGSFGLEDNWDEWFNYLLWYLLEKESCLCGKNIEYLVSACLVLDAQASSEPYSQYKDDLRDTLGRAIMAKPYWDETQDLIERIHRVGEWRHGPECSGAISATLFLCLELLEEEQISSWLESMLRISGIHWRTNLLCWFVSAHNLQFVPHSFGNVDLRLFPTLEWEHDYLVGGSQVRFLKHKLGLLFEKLREQLDFSAFTQWMEPLLDDQSIGSQLSEWSIAERYLDYVLTGEKY